MAARKHNSGQVHSRVGQPAKVGKFGDRVLKSLRGGNYATTAAGVCGLDDDTIRNWIRWGIEDPEGEYGDFSRRARIAISEAEEEALSSVFTGDEKWKARKEFLARRHRRRWSTAKDYDVVRAFDRILDAVEKHAAPEAAGQIALVIEQALSDTVGEVGY